MCSINEKQLEYLINGINDEKCCLYEFTNESNAVEVGFSCWIQGTSADQNTNIINHQDLIENKTETVVYWPTNCDVSYAYCYVKKS